MCYLLNGYELWSPALWEWVLWYPHHFKCYALRLSTNGHHILEHSIFRTFIYTVYIFGILKVNDHVVRAVVGCVSDILPPRLYSFLLVCRLTCIITLSSDMHKYMTIVIIMYIYIILYNFIYSGLVNDVVLFSLLDCNWLCLWT